MLSKLLTPFMQPNGIFNSRCTNVQGRAAATEKTPVLSVRPKKDFMEFIKKGGSVSKSEKTCFQVQI